MEIEILEMGRGGGGRSSKSEERLKGKWGGGVRGPCLMDGSIRVDFCEGERRVKNLEDR